MSAARCDPGACARQENMIATAAQYDPAASARSQDMTVICAGDSWVHDGDSQTFPVKLIIAIGAIAVNVAEEHTGSEALPMQLDKAKKKYGDSYRRQRPGAAIIHTGGNDLLKNLKKLMTEAGTVAIADAICQNITTFVGALLEMGIKFLVVADVPFDVDSIPFIKNMVQRHAFLDGVSIKKAEDTATAHAKIVNQKIYDMTQRLQEQIPEIRIIHFREVDELNKWKADEGLLDDTQLHPSQEGHAKLYEALLGQWNSEGFPKGSQQPSPALIQIGEEPVAPQRMQVPSKQAFGEGACTDSVDQEFSKATALVEDMNTKLTMDEKAKLYPLFKQATKGDNVSAQPGMLDLIAHRKWALWNKCRGMSAEDAKTAYIDLVKLMVKKHADDK